MPSGSTKLKQSGGVGCDDTGCLWGWRSQDPLTLQDLTLPVPHPGFSGLAPWGAGFVPSTLAGLHRLLPPQLTQEQTTITNVISLSFL